MTTKHIFVLDTGVAGLFGIGLILFPNELLALFDIADPGDAPQTLLARLLGGALVGIGVTEWLARNVIRAAALPIVRGILCFDRLAVMVSLQATLVGTANRLGWLVVGLFLFFAVARIAAGYPRAASPAAAGE